MKKKNAFHFHSEGKDLYAVVFNGANKEVPFTHLSDLLDKLDDQIKAVETENTQLNYNRANNEQTNEFLRSQLNSEKMVADKLAADYTKLKLEFERYKEANSNNFSEIRVLKSRNADLSKDLENTVNQLSRMTDLAQKLEKEKDRVPKKLWWSWFFGFTSAAIIVSLICLLLNGVISI